MAYGHEKVLCTQAKTNKQHKSKSNFVSDWWQMYIIYEHDVITRDANSLSRVKLWEISKGQCDIIYGRATSIYVSKSPGNPVTLTFFLRSREKNLVTYDIL